MVSSVLSRCFGPVYNRKRRRLAPSALQSTSGPNPILNTCLVLTRCGPRDPHAAPQPRGILDRSMSKLTAQIKQTLTIQISKFLLLMCTMKHRREKYIEYLNCRSTFIYIEPFHTCQETTNNCGLAPRYTSPLPPNLNHRYSTIFLKCKPYFVFNS